MDAPWQSQVPRPCPTAKKNPVNAVVATTGSEIATAAHLEADDAVNALLRQSRVSRPTAKLIDVNNYEKAALTFQRAAVAAEIARVEAVEASASHAGNAAAASFSESPSTPSPQPTLSVISTGTRNSNLSFTGTSFTRESSINQTQDELDEGPPVTHSKNKRRKIILSSDEDNDEAPTGQKKKKTKAAEVNSSCKF